MHLTVLRFVLRVQKVGLAPYLSLPLVGLLAWGLPVVLPIEVRAGFATAQTVEDRQAEAERLLQDGTEQLQNGRPDDAINLLERALEIYREIGNITGELSSLGNLSFAYFQASKYSYARDYMEQVVSLAREIGDERLASTLLNLAAIYYAQGDYENTEVLYQESLELFREQLGDRHPEVARALTNLGSLYQAQGRYAETEPLFQEALSIYREQLGDGNPEIVNTLSNLGDLYIAQGHFRDYQLAIDYYQESLEIALEIGDRKFQGVALGDLGNAYYSLGQYRESILYHEQAREIAYEIGDFQGEANATSSLGNIYAFLGEYETAIRYHELYLILVRNLGDRRGEANGLNNLGEVYRLLGDFDQAIEFYRESLDIATGEDYFQGVSNALGNISLIYSAQGDQEAAIEYAKKSLEIKRNNGILLGVINSLNSLGLFNARLGNFNEALVWYQEGIERAREIDDLDAYATLLFNMGATYHSLDNYSATIGALGESLLIFHEVENRASEGIVLAKLGQITAAQSQPELSIIFLKASVDVRESIRGDIRGLDTDLQQSFTNTVANDYRLLADLLLQQDRILEAQQVLDLLKVQELDDYLRGVRGVETRLTILRPEREILERYNALQQTAIEVGRELAALRQRLG